MNARRSSPVPPELHRVCLFCGADREPALPCPRCHADNEGRWTVLSKPGVGTWLLAAVILAVGLGLVWLGLGIAFGPAWEGETRAWALTAFAALGLAIAGVGAWISSLVILAKRSPRVPDLQFVAGERYGDDDFAEGTATINAGKMVSMEGESVRHSPLPTIAPRDAPPEPTTEILATLVAAGIVTVFDEKTVCWQRRADPTDVARTEAHVPRLALAIADSQAQPLLAACRAFFRSSVNGEERLEQLAPLLRADPLRLEQLHELVRALHRRGTKPSPQLLASIRDVNGVEP